MAQIPAQRRIADRGALNAALTDLVMGAGENPGRVRPEVLALLKEALANGRVEIQKRFEEDGDGAACLAAQAFLMDQLIRVIYDFAADWVYPAANPTAADRLCLAAIGGYGRGELAPQSDIDLQFLLPYKATPRLEQVIEYILYLLWDLGLKVGHATRSIDDCIRLAKDDLTIRTAVLEARYIWGEKKLFNELRRRFDKELAAGTGPAFVEAKLAERDTRHQRMGDSRYVLEPNIKDGKGGLRDLHTLFWIAKYLYSVDRAADLVQHNVLTAGEAKRFQEAQSFLWTVRCHLHYLTGRGEERLTFDAQPEIAARMGFKDRAGVLAVERFMKQYYLTAKEVGDLTRIFCAALEAEHQRKPVISFPKLNLFQRMPEGFVLEGGRLALDKGRRFRANPLDILRIFHIAQEREVDIHPRALRTIARNLPLIDQLRDDPEANQIFLEMLTSQNDPETTLRRLNEAGVFGRFMPDFGRVVAQMQHDMYHVYTVDEHTIFAIGILHGIENGKYTEQMPVASEVIHKIQSRRALYYALLLHDICKGRGGDHSELGAELALELGPKVGLTEEEVETVSWLVKYHLAMSNTAFRRDVNDPKTIADFTDIVQSLERLRLLLVLTVCDIRAVGPNVWNAWKASLLRDLYYAAEEVLSGGQPTEAAAARVGHAKELLRDALVDLPAEEVERFVGNAYAPYWLAFDTETHVYHARALQEARRSGGPLTVKTRINHVRAATEVTILTADHHGLFSRMAGAMALAGANIVDASVHTLADGTALDVFWVQDIEGKAIDRPDRIAKLVARIEQTLSGDLRPAQPLVERDRKRDRTEVFRVMPRVFVDNNASNTFTVIEVNGRDRPGLLYRLTRVLADQSVQIASAHITTYGEKAVDVFYVKDLFGLKITHDSQIDKVRAALMAALEESEEGELPGTREAVAAE